MKYVSMSTSHSWSSFTSLELQTTWVVNLPFNIFKWTYMDIPWWQTQLPFKKTSHFSFFQHLGHISIFPTSSNPKKKSETIPRNSRQIPATTRGLLGLQKGGELEETPQPLRPAGVPQDHHLIWPESHGKPRPMMGRCAQGFLKEDDGVLIWKMIWVCKCIWYRVQIRTVL